MKTPTLSLVGCTLAAAMFAAPASAQLTRVVIQGVPTNMVADWSQVVTVPDPVQPATFLALMPLSAVGTWAQWDPDPGMDLIFGAGNWSRVAMNALDWAYISPDPCAHQGAPGTAAPQSLLTTNYDYGGYTGMAGAPLFPDVTYFVADGQSYVGGLVNSWSLERWELRARGFFPSMLWNACPSSSAVTHNFTGFLGARFTYQIQ